MFGGAALAAVATGLSPAFLEAPLAFAGDDECADDLSFLLLAASDRGDPVNCNCPGSYDHPGIVHPDGAELAPTALRLGDTDTTGAQVWSTLPQWALDRACFIHHSTRTVVHSEMQKVLRLQDATDLEEMLPTLIAERGAACLGTVQTLPVNLGKYVQLTAGGLALPRIKPSALKQLLVSPQSPLASLRELRDEHLDQVHAILKRDGTTAQKRYLDARAQSRRDARKLADDAASMFDTVTDDSALSEVLAALALFKLRLTPVATVSLPFGGDNHSDPSLQEERDQHPEGVEALRLGLEVLEADGLRDKVTVAMLNVFGRNLAKEGDTGRDHWGEHAVSLILGKHVRAGVVGGLEPRGDDYYCLDIDSQTGRGVSGGDISRDVSLESVGKTIWKATGAPDAMVHAGVTRGSIIQAAIQ